MSTMPLTRVLAVSQIFYVLFLIFIDLETPGAAVPTNFAGDFRVTWAPSQVKVLDGGQQLQLTLDENSGAGFASKNQYLFGSIDMQIKLVPGDSAGTVTAYYLSSRTANHDELDFEFLGNVSGEPYILQTNVYANGVGNREQRVYLWFDPTADFHTYSISWNKQRITFLVDNIPIRVFKNNEDLGVPFPERQAMGVYSSIWNGDSWATRGGRVKINWNHSPFTATYQNFLADACIATDNAGTNCMTSAAGSHVTSINVDKLEWVQRNYMIYNYCSDKPRFPVAPPNAHVQHKKGLPPNRNTQKTRVMIHEQSCLFLTLDIRRNNY